MLIMGYVCERPRAGRRRHHPGVETAVGILLVIVSLASVVVVAALFVWGARKDGEADRALQARLGIRRKTRLGR